jgi:phage tail-like protein
MAAVAPVTVFNFRVVFTAEQKEDTLIESGDALATVGARAQSLVPSTASGTIRLGFAEVSGLNSELEMEDFREGGRNIGPRRFPRWGRYPNIVLRRGITSDTALWDWWADVIMRSYTLDPKGTPKPQPVPRRNAVILVDGFNHKAVAGWFVSNALPERLSGPGLNARGNEIAIETLELSHEGVLRLSPLPSGV